MDALYNDVNDAALQLREWLAPHRRLFVLTGAGCSTDSGIPDYRDAQGQWKRSQPITWQAFTGDPLANARYWARSLVGWPPLAQAHPGEAHNALAQLERDGRVHQLVTQNVDGLHQRAGSHNVIDLHGRIDAVLCLDCNWRGRRASIQPVLLELNPDWADLDAGTAPDGDADLEHADFASFRAPPCPSCAGRLKPDVVFFGENVPRERYEAARAALDESDALLVVGSSLMVYSGFRFARIARETGRPLAILNRGHTRADALADLKLDASAGPVLARALGTTPPTSL